MKYKIITLLILILFTCGCSATYDLEIKKDNSANEKITIKDVDYYYQTDSIDHIISETFVNKENIDYEINMSDLIINRKTDNYYDLNDNYEIKNSFGVISISKNRILFKPDYDKCIFMFSDGGEYTTNDEIIINVDIPYNVSKTNAISNENNKYTWKYNIQKCSDEAYIEIGYSRVSIVLKIIIVILIISIAWVVIHFLKRSE